MVPIHKMTTSHYHLLSSSSNTLSLMPMMVGSALLATADEDATNDVAAASPHRQQQQHLFLLQNMPAFTAPTIILTAAAILYSTVVRHPSSHLNRKSAIFMLLLALQVSIQPKLSQTFLKPQDNKVVVALMEEMVKTTMAVVLFFVVQDAPTRQLALADWSLSSSLLVAALPAALYAVQGVLTYTSLQRLDAVTFNGLSQLKMVSAAIWCFILLGTTQSMQQMAAIAVLLISAVIFQHQPNTTTTTSISTTTTTTTITTTTGQENDEKMKKNKSVSVTGVVTCLAATFVSGLAGALSQRGVQFVGRQHSLPRDPFLFAGEVSFYSALCLVGSLFQQRQQRPWSTKQQQQHPHDSKLFQHIRPWIPVTVKAMGGIVTVLVHKYAGSVLKGFALVLGLVLSGVYEYDHLTAHQIVGTVLVLLSSWMHFTSP